MHTKDEQIHSFDTVEQVVVDTLRFKRKLAIGEDAYASLRISKRLQQLWDVGGVAASGAGLAASPTIAGTFFASSGWMASIGLGAAATTPIGWIIGAAFATGGAYYGVTRLFRSYGDSRVETIPKFINTPIDLLGASLLDFAGALSIKVAAIDGQIHTSEINTIKKYFVSEWGYDPNYVDSALVVLVENTHKSTIVEMVATFAGFLKKNPDCNFQSIRVELLEFLRSVAQADGRIDEREDLAIDKVAQIMEHQASVTTAMSDTLNSAAKTASTPFAVGKNLIGGMFKRTRQD